MKLDLVLSKMDLCLSTEKAKKKYNIAFPVPLKEIFQIQMFEEYIAENQHIYNQLVSCNFKKRKFNYRYICCNF